MEKKKLILFHPALPPYRVDLFNSIDSSFNAKFYFFNENLMNQNFDQNKLKEGISFECNYLKRGFNLPGRSFRFGVTKILKKSKPDIVISTEYNLMNLMFVVLRFFSKKKFKIYSICDDNISVAKNVSLLKKYFRTFLLLNLDGIILTHTEIAEWYKINLNPKTKLLVLPLIRQEKIFLKELANSVPVAQKYISKYQLKEKKVLLFVGRLVEVKNIERLIKAFNIVQKKDKNLILVLVGAGELNDFLKEKIKELYLSNSVIMPGRYEGVDLLAWYLTADIFILPSTSEPFGAVINEALLAGNYVLSSNLAGGASLILDGVNGNTFNPYNINEIANIIISTLQNKELFLNQGELKNSRMLNTYKEAFNFFVNKLN